MEIDEDLSFTILKLCSWLGCESFEEVKTVASKSLKSKTKTGSGSREEVMEGWKMRPSKKKIYF